MRYVPSNPWESEEDVVAENYGNPRQWRTVRVPKKETPRRDRHDEYEEQSELRDD